MKNSKEDISLCRITLFLKIGILGAFVILAGDMFMGWGLKDMSKPGIEAQLSLYLTISDSRMFWAAVLGFTGVPLAVVGHYGILKLLKPYSLKYARLYAIGILGFLAFGGAGVHVSSVEAAFFYKYMTAAEAGAVLESTAKFASHFLLSLYLVLLTGWIIMVYAHISAVSRGFSPYPRWCWVFSMSTGSLLFSLVGLFGNHEIINALMMVVFSMGNIWSLVGHLWMLYKIKGTKMNFCLNGNRKV